ncbi:MAG TPA: DNA alkylation repair protein [Vicinamibacterales bacterium]
MRELRRLGRPSDGFDASRYFRGDQDFAFYNVGTAKMRALARSIHVDHRHWTIDEAMAFADILMVDRHLEAKAVGVEVVARHSREFTPVLLARWKEWFVRNRSANWATTDHICGALIGPLLVGHPRAAARLRSWSTHSNMWVRRASIVGVIRLARKGLALDQLYSVARRLHANKEDLIQKAVGWALREAGKADPDRLERYLRANGPRIPRTTLRYAIERFPVRKRAELLRVTRSLG